MGRLLDRLSIFRGSSPRSRALRVACGNGGTEKAPGRGADGSPRPYRLSEQGTGAAGREARAAGLGFLRVAWVGAFDDSFARSRLPGQACCPVPARATAAGWSAPRAPHVQPDRVQGCLCVRPRTMPDPHRDQLSNRQLLTSLHVQPDRVRHLLLRPDDPGPSRQLPGEPLRTTGLWAPSAAAPGRCPT